MKKHNLLFVDDEENVLRSLKRIFMDVEEYEVFTASDGKEALDLVDREHFSLILSDFRMPGIDGVEMLKRAKEKSPDTIRMILTGFADVQVAIAAINEGEIDKFIEKPWDSTQIKIHIKRAIEFYELKRERERLQKMIRRQNEALKSFNEELERRVEEKTAELQCAYDQLQMKVRELKGRDRILQSLLTINSLDEILEYIVTVILETIPFDRLVVYVADPEAEKMLPMAGGAMDNGTITPLRTKLEKYPPLPLLRIDGEDAELLTGGSEKNRIKEYAFILPVERSGDCLGVLMVDNSVSKEPVSRGMLQSLSGFSSLAALAINDQNVTSSLKDTMDNFEDIIGDMR